MVQASTPTSQSLAATLQQLLRGHKAHPSLGDIIGRIDSDDGFGPVLFVLTLPVLLPLPPGVSMILALPLLIVAPQIVIGRHKLWLPATLANRPIKRSDLVKLGRRIMPVLKTVETIVRPRLSFLARGVGARLVGVVCTLIALVLVLPIPFANLVPAIAMAVFALGLARKDGLLVVAGYALVILAVVVISLGIRGVRFGFSHLLTLI